MLLKDCPVGSMVRLASFRGDENWGEKCDWWGGVFPVFIQDGQKTVKTNDGDIYTEDETDSDFQFKIVSQPTTPSNRARQITLDGVTYELTPVGERKTIEIDGVEYYMEPA